jgi:hypothetical protein
VWGPAKPSVFLVWKKQCPSLIKKFLIQTHLKILRKMKPKLLLCLACLAMPLLVLAQHNDVHMIDFSSSLPYVLLFYFVTFISLCLFLLKLLRPNFPAYWIFISCIVGIIGAVVVTMSFDDIQNTQLPKVEQNDISEEKLSPHIKEKVKIQQRDVENQKYANFWIISIPNVILLLLALINQFIQRKRDPSVRRGRYD